MKKSTAFILLAIAFLGSSIVNAQTSTNLSPEFGARFSAKVNKKIVNRLHVTLEEEIRLNNNFATFGRFQTTLFLNYKLSDNVKVGLGYAMINPYSSSSESFKNPRHRMLFDAKYTLSLGYWNLSLKERLQMTHRTGDYNIYQNPANAFTLKSRLKAQYKGMGKLSPYAYFEIRHYLNAPVINAAFDGSSYYTINDLTETGSPGWFLSGFNGCYLNRYRGSLGVDIRLNRNSIINLYILTDYVTDKVVDANSEGTKLKSYTKESGFIGWFGAGYGFTF